MDRRPKPNLVYYKVGFAILSALTVALLIFVLSQAGGAKQDAKTEKAANDIATKLNNYIDGKQEVPANLAAANIKDVPPTITYKKLSDDSYKFCTNYKSASSGFDGTTVLDDAISRGLYGSSSAGIDSGYPDDTSVGGADHSYLYITYTHKKGESCQTITSAVYSTSSNPDDDQSVSTYSTNPKEDAAGWGDSSKVCYLDGYSTHYSGVVTSVTAANNQDLILKVKPNGASPVGEQTFTVPATAYNVFDNSCTAISHSSIITGDNIAIFQNNSTKGVLDAIANFYQ